MRIYDRYNSYGNVYDRNTEGREFVEIIPCDQCKTFFWSNDERDLVQNAVELIRALAEFGRNKRCALSAATYDAWDARDGIFLGNLLSPLREPFEYSNDDVGLIQYVLHLAAFAGPAHIDIRLLDVICGNIEKLVGHIEYKHREDQAPWDRFCLEKLDGFDETDLVRFLPYVRGKSKQEIAEYLKQGWEKLDRCKKCNEILATVKHEGKIGDLCQKCEPQQVFENSAGGKQAPSL